MKVTVIQIVIGSLGAAPKSLVKELEKLELAETIKTATMQRSDRILRRVVETRVYLLSLWLQWEIFS